MVKGTTNHNFLLTQLSRVKLRRHHHLLKNQQETMEELIKDSLRDIYRFTWNLPGTREVLANRPHLMIWSDNGKFPFYVLPLILIRCIQ